MVVLFDFDEVFVNLNAPALRYINQKTGLSFSEKDVTSWDFFEQPQTKKHFMDFLALPDLYQNHVDVNHDMIAILKSMVDRGEKVYIVTASVESSMASKDKFIREHMGFFDKAKVFTVNSKTQYRHKSDVLNEIALDHNEPTVLVDDGVHNVLDMMADSRHKKKLDAVMGKFYSSRRLTKFDNPYHDFIYGIIPSREYNNIDEGGRIYHINSAKQIWSIFKKIEKQHELRIQNKRSEVFNFLHNIVNDQLPKDQFSQINEQQNNVSHFVGHMLVQNEHREFLSDIARFCVKISAVIEGKPSPEKALKQMFEMSDLKFGNNVLYEEIKSLIEATVLKNGTPVDEFCKKYDVYRDNCCPNLLKELIDISIQNMGVAQNLMEKGGKDGVTTVLEESGSPSDWAAQTPSSLKANLVLALNKNLSLSGNGEVLVVNPKINQIRESVLPPPRARTKNKP